MSAPLVPAGRPSSFTVTTGLDLLDEWSPRATQAQKNIIHQVLFAIANKTVFADYIVVYDTHDHMEFFILAKGDLIVKIRIEGLDSFGILYIGPSRTAPGLDLALSAAPVPDPAEANDDSQWDEWENM